MLSAASLSRPLTMRFCRSACRFAHAHGEFALTGDEVPVFALHNHLDRHQDAAKLLRRDVFLAVHDK